MSSKLESHSGFYDKYWDSAGIYTQGQHVPLASPIRRLLESSIQTDSRCLDVGCGNGKTAGIWLSELTKGYVGVDISENAVRQASERGLDARLIEDASSLPFSGETFDFVLCTEVLEHLFQPQSAAREMLRVLRPGGTFIATVPNTTHWRHRLSFCISGRFDPCGDELSAEQPWRDPHIRFFTSNTLKQMIVLAGFERVSIQGGPAPEKLRRIPWVYKNFDRIAGLPFFPIDVCTRLIAIAHKPMDRIR